jgi:rfaE bifunctional protein nucleotidyltransferase chain/domain/rfaE bifunctional protein kinase chain/domain
VIVTVVGDAFLDRDIEGRVQRVCPDAPAPVLDVATERTRAGGAALAAVLAARVAPPDVGVRLVAALADDAAARELRAQVEGAGVELVALARGGPTIEKVRVRATGQSLVRMDRGSRRDRVEPSARAAAAIAASDALLVSDYAAGVVAAVRRSVAEAPGRRPVVWDPHPEGPPPVAGAWLVTPNEDEARAAAGLRDGPRLRLAAEAGRMLGRSWGARGVAVTLGEAGAMLVEPAGPPLLVPASPAHGDASGAGDCLAAVATVALAGGALPSEALGAAVGAASEFVATSHFDAARPAPPAQAVDPAVPGGARDAVALAARVRAAGGTVVATGGCFDLVHAGHVALLERARALGDCLVVCLNSDASVSRLKGPGRPVQTDVDRAAVLRAIGAVDAVAIFDEDTPVGLLDALRPHVFVKGGDYALGELPEAATVASWGGQVVILPYLRGRSTTALLERATRG